MSPFPEYLVVVNGVFRPALAMTSRLVNEIVLWIIPRRCSLLACNDRLLEQSLAHFCPVPASILPKQYLFIVQELAWASDWSQKAVWMRPSS